MDTIKLYISTLCDTDIKKTCIAREGKGKSHVGTSRMEVRGNQMECTTTHGGITVHQEILVVI